MLQPFDSSPFNHMIFFLIICIFELPVQKLESPKFNQNTNKFEELERTFYHVSYREYQDPKGLSEGLCLHISGQRASSPTQTTIHTFIHLTGPSLLIF